MQDWIWLSSETLRVAIIPYGGRICAILTPDRTGSYGDIALGYATTAEYKKVNNYYGAIIGRVANRIREGRFQVNGKSYAVAVNNAPNHLHGGPLGFHNCEWSVLEATTNKLVLSYTSTDGAEGYPGNVRTETTYKIEGNDLHIEYSAVADAATPFNLSHHSFFNLKGEGNGDILGHEIEIIADAFTPVDETLIPTGIIQSVKNTPFDFSKRKAIGLQIDANDEQIVRGRGYDHNFVLSKKQPSIPELAARVVEPTSGRTLELYTTAPGMQFYTGNFMDGSDIGKTGKRYERRTAFCMEPQHFPDAINQPAFPPVLLNPGQIYSQQSFYRFGVVD